MQDRPNEARPDNPLRHLTPAQFMALGGNAVVYVKPIGGAQLAQMMGQPDLAQDEEFHLVVSADGSPLLIADSAESAAEWLSDKNYGIVTLH
ncbi:MAG TPA: DUF1150 family protein [Alphaproteobacteria bacterium]|nr:DUF1150 family protein [Alphaproteobacteria bacterium]